MNTNIKPFAYCLIILTSLTQTFYSNNALCNLAFTSGPTSNIKIENILSYSAEDMDQAIRIMYNMSIFNGNDGKQMLIQLHDNISNQVAYYKERRDHNYDHQQLQYALASFATLLASIGSTYYAYKKFIFPKISEANAIKKELTAMGLKITEKAIGYVYCLTMLSSQNLLAHELEACKNGAQKLTALTDSQLTRTKIITIMGTFSILYSAVGMVMFLSQALHPQYKEYYEKFTLLEDRLEQAIANI